MLSSPSSPLKNYLLSSSSSRALIQNAIIPRRAITEYTTNEPNIVGTIPLVYENVTNRPAKIGPPPRLKLAPRAARAFNFALSDGSTARFCAIVRAAFQLLNEMSIMPLSTDRYVNMTACDLMSNDRGMKITGGTAKRQDDTIVLCNPSLFIDTEKIKYWQITNSSPLPAPMKPMAVSSIPKPPIFAIANSGKHSSRMET